MTDIKSQNERAIAKSASELLMLGKQTLEAQAVLAALQRTLAQTQDRISDRQQMALLVEANQQLVMSILSAQADADLASKTEPAHHYPQLRDANEQLIVAALSAQNFQALAERALGQERKILAVVAHELRNPLTPITLIVGKMARASAEELPRLQALLEGQVYQLARLVDDLLDISRASTGKLRMDFLVVNVVPLIHSVIEASMPALRARQIEFTSHLPDVSLNVLGDSVRLIQVVANILNDAIKYTPKNGVVSLGLGVEDGVLLLSIADNGIGISSHVLPHIFDAFVQDANATVFDNVGLGIGLSVVRELVEAHGGNVIGLSDGIGLGSTFIVTLPLTADS